jgi:hypothetical protein
MKKLLMVLILFIGFNLSGMAQTVTTPEKKLQSKNKVAPTAMKSIPDKTAKVSKATTKAPAPAATKPAMDQKKSATKSAVVLKKDGTPDKRYKNSTATGPLKKDGTPDMRYKENKKTK